MMWSSNTGVVVSAWTGCLPTNVCAFYPARLRRYDVVAMDVPIVFNKYREHSAIGKMYALKRYRSELYVRPRRTDAASFVVRCCICCPSACRRTRARS